MKLDESLNLGIPSKYDTRWTLLVPKVGHFGGLNIETDRRVLSRFRQRVARRFGGMTSDAAEGVWLRPRDNAEIADDLEKIEVLGRQTNSSRKYMLGIAESMLIELGQEEVFLQEEKVINWSLKPTIFSFVPVPLLLDDGRLSVDFVTPASTCLA
jgi:hypothetical protein